MLQRSYCILVQKTRANKLGLFGFDHFQGAFLSTCLLSRRLALFQQFLDDAGSVDGNKQDLKVAQSVKVDSATGPLQKNISLNSQGNCNADMEMFAMPASSHDRDVMPKTRGVM